MFLRSHFHSPIHHSHTRTHSKVSFAWSGFNNAMVSNVGMVLRNIYSKKFLGQLNVSVLALWWHAGAG